MPSRLVPYQTLYMHGQKYILEDVHMNDNSRLKKLNAKFLAAKVVFPMKQVYWIETRDQNTATPYLFLGFQHRLHQLDKFQANCR